MAWVRKSKQIQMSVNYYHPSSCLNRTHLPTFPTINCKKGPRDRVKHFTNVQIKGLKRIRDELFLQPILLLMLLETPNGVGLIQIIYIWFCNAWYNVSVTDLPF